MTSKSDRTRSFTIEIKDPSGTREVSVTGRAVLGREKGDIVVRQPDVSHRHLAFDIVDGQLMIADLGSRTGTFVNGQRIEQTTALGSGDEIQVGGLSLVVTGLTIGGSPSGS